MVAAFAPALAWAGDIRLAWDPSPDAAVVGYVVYYGNAPGSYTQSVDVGNQTSFLLSDLPAHVPWYFVVRGYTADRQLSAPSNEVSGTPGFTDHPLVPGVHKMRLVHLTELRGRIDSLRTAHGLTPATWTPIVAGSTAVSASHIEEMRTALNEVYGVVGRTPPAFTDSLLLGRVSIIKAAHISELRAAVLAME